MSTPHKAPTVSRRSTLAGLGIGALGLTLAAHRSIASAQDATPSPNPDGVAGELLGADLPTSVPRMELAVRRTTIAPGGGLPPHGHPGAIQFVVDAGTWGYTPLGGTIRVTRASGDGTPTPTEEVAMGVELILTKGDALFAEASHDEMRNAGEDDVVLLMAVLTPVGEDFQTDGPPAP